LLINRADNKLKKVIEESNVGKQQFGNVDEVVSYLKEEAAKKSISPEELDKLALKVAVFDNVLTQAAVDLMARYSEGDLKKLLEDLDIYQANLKTWTDLQEYIDSKTGGKIKPNDLNKIAADILADVDPAIALIKEKILIYSNNSKDSTIIRQSVTSVDKSNMKTREGWLQSFYNQTINLGSTNNNMSDLLVTISSLPGSDVYKYLEDLAGQSDEPVKSALKAIDLKKEKIKNPEELLTYLITNKDKTKYPEDAVFKAIANLITIKDINADIINKQVSSTGSTNLWILWIIIGSGLIFIFFLFWKRRNKNKE
jgi:LPXTG-motif cell wall-anchored protein